MADTWQAAVYAALKAADVRQIGYVPDAGPFAPHQRRRD